MSDDFKAPERTRRYDPEQDDAKILVGFKVVKKQYSALRAIFAELGQSDTALKRALKDGHGIEFDVLDDPDIFFIVSQEQTDGLKTAGVKSPTWLQLLGTSEIAALSEEDAIARYRSMKEE